MSTTNDAREYPYDSLSELEKMVYEPEIVKLSILKELYEGYLQDNCYRPNPLFKQLKKDEDK